MSYLRLLSIKSYFLCTEARKRRRVKLLQESLLKVVPDQEEQKVIHNLFQKTINLDALSFEERHLPPRSIWMTDTKLGNIVFSHPEVIHYFLTILIVLLRNKVGDHSPHSVICKHIIFDNK